MGCTTTTLKTCVIISNILCAIFGAVMITASAYSLVDFPNSELVQVPCIVGLALGSALFLTIIPGCCGALRGSLRAIWIYAICVWILMCAQITINLVLPLNFDKLAREIIDNSWRSEFSHNGTMASYEIKYSCCGKFGPEDYPSSGLSIPLSCYAKTNSTGGTELYTVGCVEKLIGEFQSADRVETISNWILVGAEFLSGLIAGMLAINLKNTLRRKLFH